MLFESLSQYASLGVCPMHMPGHKRNTGLLGRDLPLEIDITEIDGFDNLHNPQGILRRVTEAASALYASRASFLLVNGSTGGILAAVRAAVKPGDTVIMARNCHKSVYHAAELCALKTVYLLPARDEATGLDGSIEPEQVEKALSEHPAARLVIVTSPTYAGVASDTGSIAAIAHRRGVPLLVDQAHGAHFGFSSYFPQDALQNGADLTVVSLHKTLPALTQCALAHVGGDLIDPERLARELSVFETSSPSYVLLASIDRCVQILTEKKDTLFKDFEENLTFFDRKIEGLKKLTVVCHGGDSLLGHKEFFGFDPGKIVICTGNTNLTGVSLMELLREKYRIELEMSSAGYALAIATVCDKPSHFDLLAQALIDIDAGITENSRVTSSGTRLSLPVQVKTICEALYEEGRIIPLDETVGMMSLDYVWAYPPGVPLIVPGEIVDYGMIAEMKRLISSGVGLMSTSGKMPESLRVKPSDVPIH
ncbi:Arginine decarboxylase [bioreactor metagenome]|uniref:Arginine decarboxylase n=1 Tax=bioreactor metagenome TaxID=1076179 RepID=A0A644YTV2_9ZZZZ